MTHIEIHRPGPRAWATLIVCESKMVIRDTAGLLIPLGLPLLILVMNGLNTAGQPPQVFERYVMPLVLTIVIATVGVVNMPSFLAYYRRLKILRRLAVTPANPAMVLAAQMIVGLAQCLVGIIIGVTVAVTLFGAGLPANLGTAIAVLGLATLAMFAVGALVAAVAPTGNAAVAIGLTLFFALGATGGMFGSTENLPSGLATVGEALPFGAAVQAMGDAWTGAPTDPAHLIALAIAFVVSALGAVALFRWD